MKAQDEYTEEDRLYGAWLALRGQINKIDYGQSVEDYAGQRRDLYCSAARNSSACCAINPTRRAFQWWKRNFRIARRVPPGYPS
ncbi:TPA: hypothetical protein ACKROA_002683 [Pseudomonas aeruginosa]